MEAGGNFNTIPTPSPNYEPRRLPTETSWASSWDTSLTSAPIPDAPILPPGPFGWQGSYVSQISLEPSFQSSPYLEHQLGLDPRPITAYPYPATPSHSAYYGPTGPATINPLHCQTPVQSRLPLFLPAPAQREVEVESLAESTDTGNESTHPFDSSPAQKLAEAEDSDSESDDSDDDMGKTPFRARPTLSVLPPAPFNQLDGHLGPPLLYSPEQLHEEAEASLTSTLTLTTAAPPAAPKLRTSKLAAPIKVEAALPRPKRVKTNSSPSLKNTTLPPTPVSPQKKVTSAHPSNKRSATTSLQPSRPSRMSSRATAASKRLTAITALNSSADSQSPASTFVCDSPNSAYAPSSSALSVKEESPAASDEEYRPPCPSSRASKNRKALPIKAGSKGNGGKQKKAVRYSAGRQVQNQKAQAKYRGKIKNRAELTWNYAVSVTKLFKGLEGNPRLKKGFEHLRAEYLRTLHDMDLAAAGKFRTLTASK